MLPAVLGLDIGGANLKAAHSSGPIVVRAFELWRAPALLPAALSALQLRFPPSDFLAVTMTGELCDCFATKREGVRAILDAVEQAAGQARIRVWRSDGRFAASAAARAEPLLTAAANWLALATYIGRWASSGAALLVDIGSTTTDIVPLLDGKPVPRGRCDPERMRYRELVYTGCRRTPLCALLGGEGAAEVFATTLDVYLALGLIPPSESDRGTADGRPATRDAAHGRLARMLCGDAETIALEETMELARELADRQARLIRDAINFVCGNAGSGPFPLVVLSGSGEFLGRLVLARAPAFPLERVISMSDRLGPAVSEAACAFAVCHLAQEAECARG